MKRTSIILTLLLLTSLSFGQNFMTEFGVYLQKGDTAKESEVLKKWEKTSPKDAELFTCYFNYYFQKAKQEVLSLSVDQPQGKSLAFQDSTGKTAGFIGSQIMYDNKTLEKGLDKIDQGIDLYPDRLDMRFGKIYALGQIKDWNRFTNEIVKTVQYSAKNNNQWTWTNHEKKQNGKEFFLSSLQDYQLNLYNTGDDSLLTNMRTIASEILKYYPNHVESLSNLSITYLLTKKYDNALEALNKAEEIAPTDPIILNNIAQAYKLKGMKEKAIEYYKKSIKYSDKESAAYAKEQIEKLSK